MSHKQRLAKLETSILGQLRASRSAAVGELCDWFETCTDEDVRQAWARMVASAGVNGVYSPDQVSASDRRTFDAALEYQIPEDLRRRLIAASGV